MEMDRDVHDGSSGGGGDEAGMMETEEEWGTAYPVASGSSAAAGNGLEAEMEEESEEWGVVRSPTVNGTGGGGDGDASSSSTLDDVFDPARAAGTLYEKVAAGAFELILDEKTYTSAQQHQQLVEEVVACLPYLVRVALANPAHSILFQKLHSLPQAHAPPPHKSREICA
jgi:hypothetical protein